MLPYTYLPRHGEEITVVREGGTARIGVTRHTAMASAVIPAYDMPGFAASVVAALYEAAGLPAPVILDRPETSPDGTSTPLERIYLHPSLNGMLVAVDWHPNLTYLTPGDARTTASVLAAYADAAEAADAAGADEDEVRELARVLHRTHCIPGGCCNEEPSSGDLEEARTALRWMKDQQRGGVRNG
jgi:hypothetical protein